MELTTTKNLNSIRPMIYKQARECADKIKSNINNVRALVLELYERDGWTALGYTSWRECVTKEFQSSQAYLYRQLEAAQTEKVISPIGEKKEIPESQLRPLTKLKDNPEQQREAWKKAVETAPEGKVTAAHVSKVVKAMTAPPKSKEEPKTHRMVSEAMGIAEFAIVHLERIRRDDPDRNEALQKVIRWCEIMIGGKNGK